MTRRKGAKQAPRDFSLPLAGVTAHARPAARPPPGGHSPATPYGRWKRQAVARYLAQDEARVCVMVQ
eukprot:6729230-Prymnesium_polylepis.1